METTVTLPGTGVRMPNVRLASPQGRSVQINDFRHRCNLIVAFVAEGESAASERLLSELARSVPDFDFEDANVLAIVKGSAETAVRLQTRYNLSFPVLVDADGSAHRQAGAWSTTGAAATIFVLDRYGKIYAVYGPLEEASPPGADEIVEWLEFINLQCPECGVPEWPTA